MKISLLIIAITSSLVLAAQKKDSVAPVSIYLTFDDGPMKASRYLVEAIQRDSIPVTVFAVGRQVMKNIENYFTFLWYRFNPLVEIVNHSYSHANGKYKWYYEHPAVVVADILLNEDTLRLYNKIARLPGRNVWRVDQRRRHDLADATIAADSLSALGYDIFGWDLEWCYDTSGKTNYTAAHMLDQVRSIAKHHNSFIKDHIIILCHDPMLLNEQTRKEFECFIQQVKAGREFTFRLISEYPVKRWLVRD